MTSRDIPGVITRAKSQAFLPHSFKSVTSSLIGPTIKFLLKSFIHSSTFFAFGQFSDFLSILNCAPLFSMHSVCLYYQRTHSSTCFFTQHYFLTYTSDILFISLIIKKSLTLSICTASSWIFSSPYISPSHSHALSQAQTRPHSGTLHIRVLYHQYALVISSSIPLILSRNI